MKTKLIAAAAISLSMAALLATPAHATTAAECQELIADLRADTTAAPSLTVKARTSLVGKAEAAAAKLHAGKVADSIVKLTDYDTTLAALHDAAKPKVSDEDFLLLDADVDAALQCVENIDAP